MSSSITEEDSNATPNPSCAKICSPVPSEVNTRWKIPTWLCPLCDWFDAGPQNCDYNAVEVHIFEQ